MWWNPNLLQLRKEVASSWRRLHRAIQLSQQTRQAYKGPEKEEYKAAQNHYFSEIKKAKIDAWNNFLEKNDSKSIFQALKYTK